MKINKTLSNTHLKSTINDNIGESQTEPKPGLSYVVRQAQIIQKV